MLPSQWLPASAVAAITIIPPWPPLLPPNPDRRRLFRTLHTPFCHFRARAPRHVSSLQTHRWYHQHSFEWVNRRPVFDGRLLSAPAAAARDRLRDALHHRALLAAIAPRLPPSPYSLHPPPSLPPSPHAVHPFSAAAGLQASLSLELHDPSAASVFAAYSRDPSVLARSISPDLESRTPTIGLGLRFAASFDIPFYSTMHEAGFCATPTQLRELRLEAVRLQAAARQLQHAWFLREPARVASSHAQMLPACLLIQRAARGALVRWRLYLASWDGADEAGPLPPHWDWMYDQVTGQRVFFHVLGEQRPVVEGSPDHRPGSIGDLSFPPRWPPTSLQRQREMRGLPGCLPTVRPPAHMLIADCSSDDGSESGAGFGYGEPGAFSDCEFYADEW